MPKLKTRGQIHDTLTGFDFRTDPAPTRQKAIRLKCIECTNGQNETIRSCQIVDCPLWPYRLGRGCTQDPTGRQVAPRNALQQQTDTKGTTTTPEASESAKCAIGRH